MTFSAVDRAVFFQNITASQSALSHAKTWALGRSKDDWCWKDLFSKTKDSPFALIRACTNLAGGADLSHEPNIELWKLAYDVMRASANGPPADWDKYESEFVPAIISDRKKYEHLERLINGGLCPLYIRRRLTDDIPNIKLADWTPVTVLAALHVKQAITEAGATHVVKFPTIESVRAQLKCDDLFYKANRAAQIRSIQAQIQWAVYCTGDLLSQHASAILLALKLPVNEAAVRNPWYSFRVMAEYEFRRNRSRYNQADWEVVPRIASNLLENFPDEMAFHLEEYKTKKKKQVGRAQMMCGRLNMPGDHTYATQRAAYLWALRCIHHHNDGGIPAPAPTPDLPPCPKPKENTVSKKPFETIDYVYGQNLEQISADELIDAIRRVRNEIVQLKPLADSGSQHIAKKIEDLQKAETKIVKALDAKK